MLNEVQSSSHTNEIAAQLPAGLMDAQTHNAVAPALEAEQGFGQGLQEVLVVDVGVSELLLRGQDPFLLLLLLHYLML